MVMNLDGTGVRNLTNSEASERSPAWSPDGSRIAFARENESGRHDLFTIRPYGSDLRQITSGMEIHAVNRPAWRP
jgi:Tol biopolymer transport system component